MTTLTPEQIDEWRVKIKNKIWSDFCAEPNEEHGRTLMAQFDALCDAALAGLTARRDALEEAAKVCAAYDPTGRYSNTFYVTRAIRALAAQPSSPPRESQSNKADCAAGPSPAAGGDSPTPLVDAWEFDVPYVGGDTMKVVRSEFARDLERVARQLAEAVNGDYEDAVKALAAWRELELSKERVVT